MKMFNLLTGKEVEFSEEELVTCDVHSDDYILDIPHPGTLLPLSLKKKFMISKRKLTVRDADLFTDDLFDAGKGTVITTKLNRYVVNMNRYREDAATLPDNLEEFALQGFLMDGTRAWKKDLVKKERNKLLSFYEEFHGCIQESIEKMKEEKGFALLFDCHSMNSIGRVNTPDDGKHRPDLDIGTVHGDSAHPAIISAFKESLEEDNGHLEIVMNEPYRGGYIPQVYGCPEDDVHTLMLEVNKKLYMDEKKLKPKPEEIAKLREHIAKAMDAALARARKIYS